MPAGTLSKLRVVVTTDGTATSGQVTLTVMVQGMDTTLTCSVGKNSGICGSGGQSVQLQAGDNFAVKVVSTLDQGSYAYTYSLLFD